jgi:hypothetical protein
MTATVYVLIPEAVYDHGVIGVYSTEALARAAAEEIWPRTDGHHEFRIVTRVVDVTYIGVFEHKSHSDSELATGPAPIRLA